MSHEEPNPPAGAERRRSTRQGAGGAPLGSTVSIVLAVVAVVVGFLILNNITDDGGGGSVTAPSGSVPDETTGTSIGGTTIAPTTTEAPLVTEGASVVVANASGVGGSAGRMTAQLQDAGFTVVEPAINSTLPNTEASIVQYDPSVAAAQNVAESVARVMGGLRVEPLSTPPSVVGGSIGEAGVLVLLGTDEADKTIAQLSAPVAEVTPAGGTTADTTG